MIPLDVPRVKEYRAQYGCGLLDAKRAVYKAQLIAATNAAKTVDDLKMVILSILEK